MKRGRLGRRSRPRRGPTRDPAYLAFVHTLRCCARSLGTCMGPLHAHHAGQRGLGQKAADDTAIPLCMGHHSDWHDLRGVFAGMDLGDRREWAGAAIRRTRAAWETRA